MSLRIGRLMLETILPAALRISSGRTDTGAIATSDSSGSSPFESRYCLSAPPQMLLDILRVRWRYRRGLYHPRSAEAADP